MKNTYIILLLTLLLLPIVWNGVSLFHYVVAHTHTFCDTELEHTHTNPNECLTIFQLTENHHQNQLPTPAKSEFKELKQYLSQDLQITSTTLIIYQQINFVDIALPDNFFIKDIFHPPVVA